jgi:exodeoxyribonuclease V alpha subunit
MYVGQEQVEGDVLTILYSAEESGWSVFDVKDTHSGKSVRVTGVAPGVAQGEHIRAFGQWTQNTTYGPQFKSKEIHVFPPSSEKGLEAFLGSGAIDGVGPTYAKKLVQIYGTSLIEILDKRPRDIEVVRGIGPQRRQRISEAWQRHRGMRDIIMFLAEYGIGTSKAKRIHERFGDNAVSVLRGHPYHLTAISGFGFLTADGIAKKMGVAHDAPERLRAGLVHVLESAALNGHCGLRRDEALQAAVVLLQAPGPAIAEAMGTLVENGKLARETFAQGPIVMLPRLARAETTIAQVMVAMGRSAPWWNARSADERDLAVQAAEQRCAITLSASQRMAVQMALNNRVLLMTGGPGCGKTTTTRVVLEALDALGARIALAAPTGRASKRLSEVTGRAASTIHRLVGREVKGPNPAAGARHIDANVVLVDEASMVDAELMVRLLAGLQDGAVLILVGDADQLPSVGPGRVFGDLIDSGHFPVATLTEVHRQAAGSPIVSAAHAVRAGQVPRLSDTGDCVGIEVGSREEIGDVIEELMRNVLPRHYGLNVMQDVQVLTPMRRGPAGALALNERLQRILNPRSGAGVQWGGKTLAVGDRVLHTTNDYGRDVYNGDIGIVHRIDAEAGVLEVRFDDRVVAFEKQDTETLLLGYAMTVHKAQGSEIRAIIVAVAREHYPLLSRRLIYTGLTRGKAVVFVVHEKGALHLAVSKAHEERTTTLSERVGRCWS